MDPVQAVRDEIADLSRQDLGAVLGYYSEDVYFEDVTVAEPCRGKEAMREFMAGFYGAFPDLRIEIRNIIGSGNLVAAEYDLLGTHRGEFLRHPLPNRPARNHHGAGRRLDFRGRFAYLHPGDPFNLLPQRFGGAAEKLPVKLLHLNGAGRALGQGLLGRR